MLRWTHMVPLWCWAPQLEAQLLGATTHVAGLVSSEEVHFHQSLITSMLSRQAARGTGMTDYYWQDIVPHKAARGTGVA